MRWSFMAQHSGYDSAAQIQILVNSPKIRCFDKTWPIASAAPLVFVWEIVAKEAKNIGTSWEHERLMAPWRLKKYSIIYSISKLRISDPFFSRCFARPCRKKKKSKFSRSVGMAWGLTPDVHWINHGIWIFWRISYFWIKSCCPKGRKCMEISDTYLARLSSIPPPPNRSPKDQLCQRKLPIARSVGLLFLKHLTNNLTVAPCAGWRCG